MNIFYTMTVYYIDPNTNIQTNKLINIMVNITNKIAIGISSNSNIIGEKNYNIIIEEIIQIVQKYLKIYKFFSFGIKNIYVQIYNANIDVVVYVYFSIRKTNFSMTTSNWNDFYFGLLNVDPIVYNNISNNQQASLINSIVSGNFFMIDDLDFIYNTELTKGVILKLKLYQFAYQFAYQLTNTYKTCSPSNYIVTMYWN